MAKAKRVSVLVEDMEHCVECGHENPQEHHVFYGTANRKISDQDGMIIPLCLRCHANLHNDPNKTLDRKWRHIAQAKYEETHTREEFRKRYGKSYL